MLHSTAHLNFKENRTLYINESFSSLMEADITQFYNKKSPNIGLKNRPNLKAETRKIAENLEAIRTFSEEYYSDIVAKYPFAWTEKIPTNAIDLIETKSSICSSITELIIEYLKKMDIQSTLVVRKNSIHHSIIVNLGEYHKKNIAILIDINAGGESPYQKEGVMQWKWRNKPDISTPFILENFNQFLNVDIASQATHNEAIHGVHSFYSIQPEESQLFFKALSEYNTFKKFKTNKNSKESQKSFLLCMHYLKEVIQKLPEDHPLTLNAKSRISKMQEV